MNIPEYTYSVQPKKSPRAFLTPLFSNVLCKLLETKLFDIWQNYSGSVLVMFYDLAQLRNFWAANASRNRGFRDPYVTLRSDTANVNAVACYIDHITREHRGCIF